MEEQRLAEAEMAELSPEIVVVALEADHMREEGQSVQHKPTLQLNQLKSVQPLYFARLRAKNTFSGARVLVGVSHARVRQVTMYQQVIIENFIKLLYIDNFKNTFWIYRKSLECMHYAPLRINSMCKDES